MATVKEIKLKKNGAMVSPVVLIDSVKNLDGTKYKDTVTSALNGKASSSHSHAISDITNLQSTLDGKANSSHNHDDKYFTETEVLNMLSGTETSSKSYTWSFFNGASFSLDALPNIGVVYTITINATYLGYSGATNVIKSPASGKHIILGVSYSHTNSDSYVPNLTNINEYISKGYGSSVPTNTTLITGEGGQSGDLFNGTITIKMIRLA